MFEWATVPAKFAPTANWALKKKVASPHRRKLTHRVIFLPIVARELRVAARKRSTFWVRIIGALIAIVIGSGFLLLSKVGSMAFGSATLGTALFGTITWISFAAVLAAGVFLTSDCLSEEKREGTLGFLFLTDLRGHDVVSGKLLATSLQGFYGLIAVLPILAITLVLGGVSGTQLLKTSLALINALFVSLSAGLFISSISRDSQRAMGGTVLILLALAAGGPAVDSAIAEILRKSFTPILSTISPVYLFISANAWSSSPFWPTFLGNQFVGWSLFIATCTIIPRAWQEKSRTGSNASVDRSYRRKFGSVKKRTRLRRKLIDLNPALWLACRERWQTTALWIVTITLLVGFSAALAEGETSAWIVWNYVGGLFTLFLYLGVASQAARFFVDARKSGLLELLLATPLTAPQIVRGQWQGLLRMFGLPLALCLAVQFYAGYVGQRQMWRAMTGTPPPASVSTTNSTSSVVVVTNSSVAISVNGTTVASSSSDDRPSELLTAAVAVGGMLVVLGNLVALVWFGMWMGMTSRTSNLATLKTILFVQVIPWFGVTFLSAMILPALMFLGIFGANRSAAPQAVIYYPLIVSGLATLLGLIKDFVFFNWARKKLSVGFREQAAQSIAPIPRSLPPRLPPDQTPPILPPVTAA